jgi:hypothetical protein
MNVDRIYRIQDILRPIGSTFLDDSKCRQCILGMKCKPDIRMLTPKQ